MVSLIAYAALIDDQEDLLKFNALVERYQVEMFRIARGVLHDQFLAEDAVQDALYGIAVSFQKVPTDDADVLHVYCLSCAKHAALRIRQKESRFETAELTELTDVSASDNPTFEAVEQSDEYERLLAAIRQLDELYQDVLLHYYVFGQSVKVIAKLFGRKQSAVKTQLHRGRKLLAELCGKEGLLHG